MPSTTLKAVRGRVAERAYSGRYAPIISTATGGAVGTVVDSAYAIPGATTDHFDFKIIKIATDAGGAGAAPEGEVRYISEGGYTAATGTFATEVDFTAAVASGYTYEVHEIHPTEIDNIIKRKVRNLYMPTIWPLSMLIVQNDANDMEPSSIATDYDTTGGAALATETSIVYNGAQSLKSTNSVANEYFSLKALLGVNDTQSLVAAASCYVTSLDDAIFRVWDTTNVAAIDDATSDEPKWMDLIVPFSVPTGCERIDLRMIGVGSDDVIYWDDIQVWSQSRFVYPLPSWITRREQIEAVVYFPSGTAGPSADWQWRPDEWDSRKLAWGVERVDIRADNELYIWVDSPGQNRPYVIARRNLPEPTSDTSAISFEPDLIVEGVLAEVYEILAKMSSGNEAVRYIRDAAEAEGKWQAGLRSIGLLDPIEPPKPSRIFVR